MEAGLGSEYGCSYYLLRSAALATVLHLGTLSFCQRFMPPSDAARSRSLTSSARQAWQSVLEVIQRQLSDADAEVMCLAAGYRQMTLLLGEWEMFLIDGGALPWSCQSAGYMRLASSTYAPVCDDGELPEQVCWRYVQVLRSRLAFWLDNEDRLEVANALLVLTKQGLAALATELAGYRQRHVGAALTVVEDWLETSRGEWLRVACVVPPCPACGKPMRRYWEQWQCQDFPDCIGIAKG
ncbi:MAG: hypothetical protein BWX73_00489 [Lentisphaerae bacterium ADurb.Bin082]|nr:MAG: hypothetical protein BWX73_00489 [Lentisphaerae bacterium ADurb.Bin082]